MSMFKKFMSWLTAEPAKTVATPVASEPVALDPVTSEPDRIEPTFDAKAFYADSGEAAEVSFPVSFSYADLPESPYDPVEVVAEPVKKVRKPRAKKVEAPAVKKAATVKTAKKAPAKKAAAVKAPAKKTPRK